jgi:hypothetical protein
MVPKFFRAEFYVFIENLSTVHHGGQTSGNSVLNTAKQY